MPLHLRDGVLGIGGGGVGGRGECHDHNFGPGTQRDSSPSSDCADSVPGSSVITTCGRLLSGVVVFGISVLLTFCLRDG